MNPLSKVFSIIEIVVARQDRGAIYSDIIRESALPKSTVHRILKDLVRLGYLTFDPTTKRYFGSLRLAALGAEVTANFQLRKHVHPFLLELEHETEHTANFAILDGTQGVFMDKVEARDIGIRLYSEVGKPFPLHCTALGKVLLAHGPPDLFGTLVARPLVPLTEHTIVDPHRLEQELEEIKRRGYAVDKEEITRGIVCVAGPVFAFDQSVVGAISVTFPAYIDQERGIASEIAAIKKFAERISRTLGKDAPAVHPTTKH